MMMMETKKLTTTERILLDIYNSIAIDDLNLEELDDFDYITYSEYFYNHMTERSNYFLDSPLSEKIVPIYMALTIEDKNELLKILAVKNKYRQEYFYEADWIELTDDEKLEIDYDDVTQFLIKHEFLSSDNNELDINERKLISFIEDHFEMMKSLVNPSDLNTTTKYDYLDSVLREIGGLIEEEYY